MALSADSPVEKLLGEEQSYGVLASAVIYEGSMVGKSSGYARPLTAGDLFLGHSVEAKTGTAANGGEDVRVLTGRYILRVALTGVAVTDVGRDVYASDDATLTLTTVGSNSRVGRVHSYAAANTCYVEFETLFDTLQDVAQFPGKTHVDTAADLTLTAADHSGAVIDVTADAGEDTKITLPVGVVGMDFVIRNAEADAGNLLQVDLNGNEIIEGVNLTIAATKMALNTKATAKRGDYIHLVCNVAATSWRCVSKRGTWVTSA